MGLFDAAAYEPDEMLAHPRHLALQSVLSTLIEQLRACRTVEDGVALQRDLLTHLLAVQGDRHEFRRAVDRMSKHKAPQVQAPEPQSGRSTTEVETWMFERDMCDRLARQLRSVGDALSWRVFGFHRPFILALCRNDPPGPMYGKAGLKAELEHVERVWKEGGVFAILHDLTNCLRIGDVTVFDDDASPRTLEIKTNPKKARGAQIKRINEARAAVLEGGPLPGGNASEVLHNLDLPLRTHLDQLRTGIEHAAVDGIYATDIPGCRALMVIDQSACATKGMTLDNFNSESNAAFDSALSRAGIEARRDLSIHSTSLDSAALDPQRVPWGNYPLHPIACARIIGDYTVVFVETSGPKLAHLLGLTGLDARWVRPPGNGELAPGEVVMEIHREDRLRSVTLPNGFSMVPGKVLQMRRAELDRYLIELLKPGPWAAGIKHLVEKMESGQPWPHYRNEHEVWV
jgi:hypothetical protein